MFNQLQALMSTPEVTAITRGKAAAFVAAWEFWAAIWVLILVVSVIVALVVFKKGWYKDKYGDNDMRMIFIILPVMPVLFLLIHLGEYRWYQLAKHNPDAWAVQQVVNIASRIINTIY